MIKALALAEGPHRHLRTATGTTSSGHAGYGCGRRNRRGTAGLEHALIRSQSPCCANAVTVVRTASIAPGPRGRGQQLRSLGGDDCPGTPCSAPSGHQNDQSGQPDTLITGLKAKLRLTIPDERRSDFLRCNHFGDSSGGDRLKTQYPRGIWMARPDAGGPRQ